MKEAAAGSPAWDTAPVQDMGLGALVQDMEDTIMGLGITGPAPGRLLRLGDTGTALPHRLRNRDAFTVSRANTAGSVMRSTARTGRG